MIRYYVCNLENIRDFSVDDVMFKHVNDYKKNIHILREKRRDQLTFYATIPDKKFAQPSMLYGGGKTTSVNDMMILLSLAQSRNIYFPKAEDISSAETNMWGMALGGNRKAWGPQVIMDPEIEKFLTISLAKIREPKWLEKTGFKPAVFWWLESIYEHRPLETKFISGFIALEILANIHEHSKRIKNSGVRTRIEALANFYGWNFMDNILIKDWTVIRDKYMHAGSTKGLKTISNDKRATRYFQLITSVQIALIDILGFSNFARRDYVISEIKKPVRKTYKDSGPFPIPSCCDNKGESS